MTKWRVALACCCLAVLAGHHPALAQDANDGAPGRPGRVGSSEAGEPGPNGPSGEAGRSYEDRIAQREADAARRIAERTGRSYSGSSTAATDEPTASPEPTDHSSDMVEPSRSEHNAKREPAVPAAIITLVIFSAASVVVWLRRRRAT